MGKLDLLSLRSYYTSKWRSRGGDWIMTGILDGICATYINLGSTYRWCPEPGDDIIKEVGVDKKEETRAESLRFSSIKTTGTA